MLMRTTSFSPPLFSPVPSPPPPSPASSSALRPQSQRRNSKRAVFDIVLSSPQSFDGQDKTILATRLERSRKLRIAVKPGVPARLLSDKEVESGNSSSGIEKGREEAASTAGGTKAKKGTEESSSSPWVTDSDPPTRTSTPVKTRPQGKEKTTQQIRKTTGTTKIQGFEVQNSPQPVSCPPPSATRPPFSRTTSATTSSLSLLLARTPSTTQLSLPPPSTLPSTTSDDDIVQPLPVRPAGRTWNGDIVGETLAGESRPQTPSTSPSASISSRSSQPRSTRAYPPSCQSTSTHALSTSASLPSLAKASSSKRTRFLTATTSLTSTPNSSPPKSPTVLQFTRRPTCTRQGSIGEGLSRLTGAQIGRSLRRGGSTLSQQSHQDPDSDSGDTDVEEESECEELETFNRFQPSIFASHYSNSATSLSSACSSTLRNPSSISSSPKSTRGFELATSVPVAPSIPSSPVPAPPRRGSSEPKRVDLKNLRRQQLECKKKSLEPKSTETSEEGSTPRPESKQSTRRPSTTTSPVSPTSMPHLQLPWKKLFSLS